MRSTRFTRQMGVVDDHKVVAFSADKKTFVEIRLHVGA
jgi:hypothetical protein